MSNDVSLDDELLQVTEKKSKVNKKTKADKSPQRDEEGDASAGSGDDSDHKGGKRKPKSDSKKPLKKRKTGDSSDDNSSEDDAYHDGWDDDLMGDDADREKLMAMPEIEREAILSERYQKRKEMRDGWEVKRRLKAEQRAREKKEGGKKDSKESKRETKDNRETRDRTARKTDTKGKALSELKKKRAKAGYKHDSEDDDEEGQVEESKDDDDDYAPHKGASSDQDTGSMNIGKEDEEEEEIVYHDDDDDDEDQGHPVTWGEVEQLRLSRDTLEKWMDKPFFNSLVPGFFVRIGIGMDPQTRANVYRVAQVDSVVIKGSYLLRGKQTNKWLKLLIGDKAKEFKMETISNNRFSENEYKHWKLQMERAVRAMPMSKEVPKKLETLATAKDYRYTSDDIEKMLDEKKKSGALPVSVAAEKARLVILRDTATNPDEKAELEKKIAQLDELAKERSQKRVSTASVFNINQRNKQINFDTTLKSKSEEKSGNSDLDPFSRRKTMPTIVYASKYKEEEKLEEPPTPAPAPTPAPTPVPTTNGTSNSNSSHPLSSSSSALKTSTGATALPTSEHDSIDIDISALESPANPPRPVLPSHPPTSHPTPTTPPFVPTEKKTKSTLSLDDYMRRRRAME